MFVSSGGLKEDLRCVQAEAVATSPCSGGIALLSACAALHRKEIDFKKTPTQTPSAPQERAAFSIQQ